jgi:hypothetical protein
MSQSRRSEVSPLQGPTLDEALDALNRAHGPAARDRESISETLAEFENENPAAFKVIESFIGDDRDPLGGVVYLMQQQTPGTLDDSGGPQIPTFAGKG